MDMRIVDRSPIKYPEARRDEEASTTYDSLTAPGGKVTVHDPYHWLETPPSQSEETKKWVHEQAAVTAKYLEQCQPDIGILKTALEKNFAYARASNPAKKGDGRYYYSYNAGLAPQTIIYAATAAEIDETSLPMPRGEVFFDVNLLDAQRNTALKSMSFSHTGKYFAYGVSRSGSDWSRIFFRETSKPFALPKEMYGDSKQDSEAIAKFISAEGERDRLADVLDHVKYSTATWMHDDSGVFYQRYPFEDANAGVDKGTETHTSRDAQLWFHKLGTDQKDDVLVIARDELYRESCWEADVSDDGRYLIVQHARKSESKWRTFVACIADDVPLDRLQWIGLAYDFKYDLSYITNDEKRFYFKTNKDAPNRRIVYADLDTAAGAREGAVWQLTGVDVTLHDVIPENKTALLSSARVVAKNKLLVVYSRDVMDELHQFDLRSGTHEGRMLKDLVGTIYQMSCRREDTEAFVQTISFVNPGQITRFEWIGETKIPRISMYWSTIVAGIPPEQFMSEQRFFSSKDGTRVPMFLTYPKSMPHDGSRPALVYHYGGFNVSLKPVFAPSFMTWAQLYGGTVVFVNARGGGEYGDSWHRAGSLLNKQNTFDDVLAAATFLHESKVAAKGKIILSGGSNGGLGVAACINQCIPDVHGVGAGIADVGLMDMLKFHTWTIGKAWTSDYGDPSHDPAAVDCILKYSPLHNVDAGKTYPTTILACADHDDRVVPAHSFKLAAEMQHKLPNNPNPILLRVELDAGHGAGQSTQKRIAASAEKFAIIARGLQLKMIDQERRQEY